ncbi:2-oxopent-4-enoate hydratase [Castellaniella sp.]|uniref:2-oxopent-4-enoate hydratase n=1 Tax=Castellaniella sp. TaxID=1955812 RepID=UPI002AFF7388|nr:2-oxopent-4-enoate hydratase [Castellaniella sp.]
MDQTLIEQLGSSLHQALVQRNPIAPLTETYPDLSIEQAYRIQEHMLSHRIDAGARVIGKKIGVTSKAVMNMLGVFQPDFGYLLSDMVHADGATVALDTLIQPKAEGEIAFFLKKDLQGPGVTVADVYAATEGVMACFEIVDSRIRDWKIKIQDTVADNASCGLLVLGEKLVDPRQLDLTTCGMVLELDGEVSVTGSGAAALGSPVAAVAWLANQMGALGTPLKAGEIVLSGALAAMVPISGPCNLRVSIGGLGSCSVRFA